MLRTKLLAMCVCPALLAPPTILAVHKPARKAVARVLHRTADRLDRRSTPAVPVTQYAALPCAPVLAGTGDGLLLGAGGFGGGLPVTSLTGFGGDNGSSTGGGAPAMPVSGGGFVGGGGGGGSGLVVAPASPLPIGSAPTPVSGVPEPQSWALMIAGFGAVGATMRGRRLAAS